LHEALIEVRSENRFREAIQPARHANQRDEVEIRALHALSKRYPSKK